MASQTLIFVALPAGLSANKQQRCSIYLSPRLDGGATLADFPDFVNWPKTVQQNKLKFQITCGGKTATVAADLNDLQPDDWARVFSAQTPVSPYVLPDYDKRLFVSYPVRDSLTFLKYLYQATGVQKPSPTGNDHSPYGGLLDDLAFGQNGDPPLEDILQTTRAELWQQQLAAMQPGTGGVPVLTATAGIQPVVPPDGIAASTVAPANTAATMRQFSLFHHMPPAPGRLPLPSTPAEFQKLLDFHSGLTAISSYPALLRAFGLVFDVELPADFCPVSPAAGAYGTIAVAGLAPGFKWKNTPTLSFPQTSYVFDGTAFGASPAAPPATLVQNPFPAGDVVDGFLTLSAGAFQLMQVDVDGALLKTLSLAGNVYNTGGDPSVIDGTLPAMRSAGIALVANGRGLQLLQAIMNNQSFNDSLASGTGYPRPFNATDLVRGYRLDIWTSRSGKWYSLHRRNSVYQLGPANNQQTLTATDEEGFLQTAASQPADDPTRQPDPPTPGNVPQSGTDIYVHERLASWKGWSLSAPRPGLALNRDVDPGKALDADPTENEPVTALKLKTQFKAFPGSLPELRFGDHYRLRARTVDLAGNSVELTASTPDNVVQPPGGALFPYFRFEPVSPPIVIEQQKPADGNTLECLVIRTRNTQPALDSVLSPYQDSRHIAPPRVAEQMAEHHGMFDDAKGKLKGDAKTFKTIVDGDGFVIPLVDGFPLVPGAKFNVGYLPDPIARGAAFAGLPNAPDDTSGVLVKNQLVYQPLPGVQPRPGSVTFIDFGSQWPGRLAFLFTLVEGSGPPVWDAAQRVLTVFLPKAGDVTVELSSYLFEQDLDIMGVWEWMRQYFDAAEIDAIQNPSADFDVPYVGDGVALLTRLTLEGGHPMITPGRTLNLVHAVQQPLGRPAFQQLPVVHDTTQPIFASALRNSFTPITAWRSVGSHNAVLLGGLDINGASTSKVDLEAQAYEVTDDPSLPAPTKVWQGHHVETINLGALDAGPIWSDSSNTRMVATYIPQVDVLWFAAPFDTLEGVETQSEVAAPLHRFDDTKHRWVSYTAVSTSRFQEFFPEPGLVFTRESEPLIVDVPSSARPIAPEVAYVVPTFGWENQERSNVKSSMRFGNGLRVYLERPWYSSGDDELLGVVLWSGNAADPDAIEREKYKNWFTQWGGDPIWSSGALNAVPGIGDFAEPAGSAQGLTLEETTAIQVDVAGHQVQFDQGRNLWFCDIEFNQTSSYAPFVRLALARYQSHAITGVELSPVVLADFAQLTPNRSAVLLIDPTTPQNARLFVGGLAPEGPRLSTIEVSIETRWAGVESDAGWVPASGADVTVTPFDPGAEPGAVLWAGAIQFKQSPPPDKFRVVVLEYEHVQADEISFGGVAASPGRVVYAVTIPYNYP